MTGLHQLRVIRAIGVLQHRSMGRWRRERVCGVLLCCCLMYIMLHINSSSILPHYMPAGGIVRMLVGDAPPAKDDASNTRCSQTLRTRFLKRMCEETGFQSYYHEDLYVNEAHGYVACLPEKAGCTTWKTILVNNTLQTPLAADFDGMILHGGGILSYGIRMLSSYSPREQQSILSHFFKFAVVRHPLDRLVSSFNDKIKKGRFRYVRARVLELGAKRYNASDVDLRAFLEYIQHVYDPHWAPVSLLCDVCNVQYDRIVKLETQSHDVREIIPHLGPYNRSLDAHANWEGTGAAKELTWSLPAFANVNKSLLDEVLAVGFDYDLKLFGYSWRNVSSDAGLSASCGYPDEQCC